MASWAASLFGGQKDSKDDGLNDVFANATASLNAISSVVNDRVPDSAAEKKSAWISVNGAMKKKRKRKDVEDSSMAVDPSEASIPTTKRLSKKEKKPQLDTDAMVADSNEPRTNELSRKRTKRRQESTSKETEVDKPSPPSLSSSPSRSRLKRAKLPKYVPPDETPQQRDERTIFVGNVPSEVARKTSAVKPLKRHFLDLLPGSKIESIRFRSVAFQNPTAPIPVDDESSSPTTHRQQKRAAEYKETLQPSEAEGKVFLTPSQKKKVAFIKHELHDAADSVHAYIVFAHSDPNTPTAEPTLNPYEAARQAVAIGNGTTFMDRTLRVDFVKSSSTGKEGKSAPTMDTSRTVFVGNIDFSTKEEDLRAFFEGIVSTERGVPPEGKHWVEGVRIVRDKDSQLGKGFAYVLFKDRETVDEVLALEQDKLKFAKRKLRVQKCKANPSKRISTPSARPEPISHPKGTSLVKSSRTVPVIPAGDPNLGETLRGLDKDERKAAKKAIAERVERRLAKKRALKERQKGATLSRERERMRQSAKSTHKTVKAKVGRIRSEKAISKRNVKK